MSETLLHCEGVVGPSRVPVLPTTIYYDLVNEPKVVNSSSLNLLLILRSVVRYVLFLIFLSNTKNEGPTLRRTDTDDTFVISPNWTDKTVVHVFRIRHIPELLKSCEPNLKISEYKIVLRFFYRRTFVLKTLDKLSRCQDYISSLL